MGGSGLEGQLRAGQYAELLKWLRGKIHEPGQRFEPQELMRRATGEGTSARFHLEALKRKFLGAA